MADFHCMSLMMNRGVLALVSTDNLDAFKRAVNICPI